MFRIRKQFKFEAAHMLEDAFTAECHECVHGHSYTVELFICAHNLDNYEMVMDFGILKAFIDKVKNEWDHALILHGNQRKNFIALQQDSILQKVVYLAHSPTAEIMAWLLAHKFMKYLEEKQYKKRNIWVEKVRVHETHTGWAEFETPGGS